MDNADAASHAAMMANPTRIVAIATILLIGCTMHPATMTRAQLATVERAAASCTAASSALIPSLQKADRAGVENAAIAARDACSSSRAEIRATVGTGGPLDTCYVSVDQQEAMQQAELRLLDSPTPDNQHQVVNAIDKAIHEQSACEDSVRNMRSGK